MIDFSYESVVKDKIELAELIAGLSEKDATQVHKLFLEKKKIMIKNSIFANYKLNKINKKINKIRSKYSKEDITKYKESTETHSIFDENNNNNNND